MIVGDSILCFVDHTFCRKDHKRTLVVVIHVGINDIHDRQTEVLKNTFTQLTCKLKEKHFMAINKYGVHRKLLVLLIIGTYFGGAILLQERRITLKPVWGRSVCSQC